MLLENNNASISVNVRECGFRNLGNFCSWNPEYCALDSGIQLKETRITLMIAIRNTNSIDKESRIPNPVPWNPESTAWNPETKIKRENCLFMASKVRNCWKLMLSEGWKCYFRDPTFQNLTGEHDPGPRSSSRLVIDPPLPINLTLLRHCWASSNWKPVVSIQTQAVKVHKNFVHFKYSLRVNKKNILGEYLRNYLHLERIN